MPTRTGGSSANQSLKTDLTSSQNPFGRSASVAGGEIAKATFLKNASGRDLADSYKSKMAQYLALENSANKSDRDNPESHNFGSADSYARMRADSFYDSELKPIRKELESRFLNTDGKPFWKNSKEDDEDEAMNARGGNLESYKADNTPVKKLEYLMNARISPETSVNQLVDVSRPSGSGINLSKLSDQVLSGALQYAREGLADITKRSIAKDDRDENRRGIGYAERTYPPAYKQKILDPLLAEYNRRNPSTQSLES